ncbi:MAG: ATP-binding cassette domain-containing protein [Lachnospiraceae bacterium]|nr:ATP-binding cassette domain-containing protein [Lachnospiraceae bacterium]
MAFKAENIQVLYKIMQLLEGDQSDTLESSISDAMEILIREFKAESGALWLKNRDSQHIYSIVSIGDANITGFSIENGQGLIGAACESFEPVVIYDVSGDDRFPAGKDEITGIEVKNILLMPMQLRKEVIGCVEIFNRTDNEKYSEDDISLIHSFAGLASLLMDEKGYSYAPDVNKKPIMSLRGITKDYPSGLEVAHILKGIDLDIFENELLVILGESGCGKSTLLNIIGGMDSPTGGKISFDGRDFSRPSTKELVDFRRDSIGFIFQAYNLMPNLTALENVQFIAELCKHSGSAKEAIDMVGLSDRANNYPSMMSGGQQQRVSIARAIVKRPRIILADEPTAALDFSTGQEVLELIERLISEKITTVVMVTHNVEIAKMANRVVRVRNGKISSIRINSWPMHAADLVW